MPYDVIVKALGGIDGKIPVPDDTGTTCMIGLSIVPVFMVSEAILPNVFFAVIYS